MANEDGDDKESTSDRLFRVSTELANAANSLTNLVELLRRQMEPPK